jgi:hypothetical protein
VATKRKFVHLANMAPGAARNKRVAQLAANPGTRSKIPTALLPARYQAGRKTAQRIATENATLYNPAAILSGKDLRSAVKGEVDAQINPQLDAFDRTIKNLGSARDISSQRLAGYSNLYNAATANTASTTANTGNALVQQIAALGKGTQDTLGQIQSDISSQSASDTALRGAGLQDFGRAQAAVDFNKAQAAGSTNSAVNVAGGQASGANTLAGTIAAVAPMRANDQQFALAGKFNQQIADMMGKRADVEATRGDLTTKTLNQMREDQFTNMVTMKGLDLKQSDFQEQVRSNKAQEGIAKGALQQRDLASQRTAASAHAKRVLDSRQFRSKLNESKAYHQAQVDIKRGFDPITGKRLPKKPQSAADALNNFKLDFARKHGYLPPTGPPKAGKGAGKNGGFKPLTTNEKITQTQKFGTVFNAVNNAKSDFKGDRQTGGVAAGKALLKEKPDVDPLYVSVALDMAYDGHVSRQNAIKLHKRGLSVKDFNLKSASQAARERTNKSVVRNTGTKKHRRLGTGAFPPINIAP